MKIAPLMTALEKRGLQRLLVHTGQHYDIQMSDSFFRDLGIPEPDINMEVGSASHAVQTGQYHDQVRAGIPEREAGLAHCSR